MYTIVNKRQWLRSLGNFLVTCNVRIGNKTTPVCNLVHLIYHYKQFDCSSYWSKLPVFEIPHKIIDMLM